MLAGRNTVTGRSDPVPTDPFMLLVAPLERFDTDAGFATATFCEIQNGIQVRIVDDYTDIHINNVSQKNDTILL